MRKWTGPREDRFGKGQGWVLGGCSFFLGFVFMITELNDHQVFGFNATIHALKDHFHEWKGLQLGVILMTIGFIAILLNLFPDGVEIALAIERRHEKRKNKIKNKEKNSTEKPCYECETPTTNPEGFCDTCWQKLLKMAEEMEEEERAGK